MFTIKQLITSLQVSLKNLISKTNQNPQNIQTFKNLIKMLSNQRFVDPELAKNICTLEKQMKSLLQQKLQIQYNTQFMQPKRREELLRSNEQQRTQLRKIIEKSKLSMVEYLDKQVQVLSIDFVKNGAVAFKADQNFCVNAGIESENQSQGQQQQEIEANKQKSYSLQSKNSRSTNHNSHIYKPNDQSVNLMNSSSQGHTSSFIDPHQPKMRKSCLSTHYRTNSRGGKLTGNSRQKGTSQVLDGSLIDKKYNSSEIMQINEFNVTSNSPIPFMKNYQPQDQLSYPNAKSNILSYLQQQPFSDDFEEVSQLYNKKIFWLEKKCLQLQSENSQMLQVIQHQQKTIEDLESFIQQKDQQIIEFQTFSKQKNQIYDQKIFQLSSDLKLILEVIESNKQKITLSLQTNQIISKYKMNQNFSNHLPMTLQPSKDHQPRLSSFYLSSQTYPGQSPIQISKIQPEVIQTDKNEIVSLGKQLVELQMKLRQIQDENEQLKGERKLLLKKVKI